jgi:hypothetical protein
MPRKPEPSFRIKEIIWDLAATTGAENLSALYRDLDYKLERLRQSKDEDFYEDTPDIRTIQRIIEVDINRLAPEVVVTKLPPHVWRLRRDYEEIKQLAKEYSATKGAQESDLSRLLKEWSKQVANLAPAFENAVLSITGLSLATQLNTLAQRVFRNFGCYEIMGLKELHHVLSLCLGQRFDTSVGQMLKDVQLLLQQRKTIQNQILGDAKNGCESLGFVELIDNNFSLAAYHFLARGDSTWLEDGRFQTLELGTLGQWRPPVWCPLCDYNLRMQQWDTRQFICPGHNVPLITRVDASPIGIGCTPGMEMELYRELVTPVEDIATKYPSKVALSVRIPKMLPFSEVVIAVGDADSMPKFKAFVQDFLRASSSRQETQLNEVDLQKSYTNLLETLRSAPVAEEK